MRLADLTPDLLRRALAIYLDHAWPGREKEKMQRLRLSGEGAELLAGFSDESNRAGGDARRHTLRLGNLRYPHMKLVVEEQLVKGLYIFSVDTHDPDIRPDFPDYAAWKLLKEHNLRVKERIEVSWHSAGLHTEQSLEGLIGPAPPPGPQGRRGRGTRILVVDDRVYLARAVAAILRQEEFDVFLAHDGQEAVGLALGFARPSCSRTTRCPAWTASRPRGPSGPPCRGPRRRSCSPPPR